MSSGEENVPYNVLEVIEDLINDGYTEEQAERSAAYGNYNISLEDLIDN